MTKLSLHELRARVAQREAEPRAPERETPEPIPVRLLDDAALRAEVEQSRRLIATLRTEIAWLERDRDITDELLANLTADRERKVAAQRRRTDRRLARRQMPTSTAFPLIVRGADLMTDVAIYGLVDPREPERVRYVGQATKPIARMVGHVGDQNPNNLRGRWIGALFAAGVAPDMVLLERVPVGADIDGREAYWIHALRDLGQADLNSVIPRRLRP